jgi:hypothetical protein
MRRARILEPVVPAWEVERARREECSRMYAKQEARQIEQRSRFWNNVASVVAISSMLAFVVWVLTR